MNCITFGQLQKYAARSGLVMSRDRKSLLVNLRYRDERQSTTRWRGLTFHEAWMLVEGLTERRAVGKEGGGRPDISSFV